MGIEWKKKDVIRRFQAALAARISKGEQPVLADEALALGKPPTSGSGQDQ